MAWICEESEALDWLLTKHVSQRKTLGWGKVAVGQLDQGAPRPDFPSNVAQITHVYQFRGQLGSHRLQHAPTEILYIDMFHVPLNDFLHGNTWHAAGQNAVDSRGHVSS